MRVIGGVLARFDKNKRAYVHSSTRIRYRIYAEDVFDAYERLHTALSKERWSAGLSTYEETFVVERTKEVVFVGCSSRSWNLDNRRPPER